MSIKRIKDLPEGSGSLSNDDIFLFMDNPSGTAITKKISLSEIASAIGGGGGGGGSDISIGTVDLHNGGVQNAQILQFNNASYQSVITGPTPDTNTNAQRIIIQGQKGQGTGEGGDVYVWAGDASTNGGDIKIYAGDADDGASGQGGYVNIDGGKGATNGGNVEITAGYSEGNAAGNVNIIGGPTSTGTAGNVSIKTNNNNYIWAFTNSGNLNLPQGKVVNWGQNINTLGPPVAGGGTDRIRLWDFEGAGSNFNYAIGAEGNHVWFAMDVNNGTGGFKFYSRDNEIFKISDDSKLMFPNGTTVATGTFDNGLGGNHGISLNCAVGYELNWQGGHLRSSEIGNSSVTQPLYLDSPIQFPGTGITYMTMNASGITFADGTIQTTAASGTGGGSSLITVVDLGSVSGNISTPANSGSIFDLVLSASGTLSNPTNGTNGQTIRWRITFGGSGIPLSLDNNFRIPTSSSSPLPFSTTSGVTDYLTAIYHSGRNKWDVIGFVPGY